MQNIGDFIGDLDAGNFEQKLSKVLAEVAANCMAYNKKGEVKLTFKLTPINLQQAKVVHDIDSTAPTLNGQRRESNSTVTHMYVGEKGSMSLFPHNQHVMFDKNGQKA